MESGSLTLKFGTAYFIFRNEDQMRGFLETYCIMKNGKIHLHHGVQFHSFTELAPGYLKNIPKGVKIQKYKSGLFFHAVNGMPKRSDGVDFDNEENTEADES